MGGFFGGAPSIPTPPPPAPAPAPAPIQSSAPKIDATKQVEKREVGKTRRTIRSRRRTLVSLDGSQGKESILGE